MDRMRDPLKDKALCFIAGGYDFWQDRVLGVWQVVPQGSPMPTGRGGYFDVVSLAKLKGIERRDLPAEHVGDA